MYFNLASHLAFFRCDWKMGETILPVAVSLSVSRFYIFGLVHIEIDLVVFDILLANLSTVEIIAIYGIMMLATYMLFTIALAGLRKLMYDEISGDTFLNKIAKMISPLWDGYFRNRDHYQAYFGNLSIRCFNFRQGSWLLIDVDLL